MPTFRKLLGALGMKPAAKPSRQQAPSPPPQRQQLIAAAMDLYRAKAAHMRGIIDADLKQLRDSPPNPNDFEGMARLLGVRRAEADMRRLMNHRDRRYLVLVGLRELLEQKPKVAPPGAQNLVVRR